MTALPRSRHLPWIVVVICTAGIAQQGRWAHVTPNSMTSNTSAVRLPEPQRKSNERKIVSLLKAHDWGCDNNDVAELLRSLSYRRMPLKPDARIVSGTTNDGCAAGVDFCWRFDLSGKAPVHLGEWNGNPGILHSSAQGYKDVVPEGHPMGERVALVYHQFDTKPYSEIDEAVAISDGSGGGKVIPDSPEKIDSEVPRKGKRID